MNQPIIPRPAHRIVFICTACGSDAISREAWAEWDAAQQVWSLGAMFNYAHCHSCGSQTPPREVIVPPASADGSAILP